MRPIVVSTVLLAALACGGDGEPEPEAPRPVTAASCVERYSPETLRNREFAFDGTLVRIGEAPQAADEGDDPVGAGPRAVFKVNRWYSGEKADEVSLRADGFGETTSAGTVEAEPGDRYLVAGDGDIVWLCGFTTPWTAERAAEWENALAG